MKDNVYVYDFDGSTYINLTNRCNNACDFCIRKNKIGIEGYDLWIEHDAAAQDVIDQLKQKGSEDGNIVFCGYGEPTLNLEALKEVAKFAHGMGYKTRLNTNGLANAQFKRDIVPELKGLIDTISVSLNDCDAKKYDEVCHSRFGEDAFGYMLDFTKKCVEQGIDTVMTVVDVIPQENIDKCEQIAKSVGARFRVRKYSDK